MNKTIVRAVALTLAAVMLLGLLAGIVMADEYNDGQNRALYSGEEFEEKYTYEGDDLGATWSKESTTFRLWAPTATYVALNLYELGNPGTDDLKKHVKMSKDENGTWVTTVQGDLNGVYYTYQVNVDGMKNEVCDPYARAVGVNGHRAMVIDLDATDPEGWETDVDPHYDDSITDAVLYELHIRDLSSDASSGIQNTGKYLGLTEKGTTNAAGIPTGLDHILLLGVTHLHLMSGYDFASVDETTPESNAFSWGYDPVNYNVPDGSYATDPCNGAVRVSEFKQMVKALHDNGISVVMDVAYSHVSDAEEFCLNNIVPGYFTRIGADGSYSNGSEYGNDTASERAMVRKYIVDSVTYWADEYHIDGFCFDAAGVLDTETVNACIEAVHKTHPNVIFYGEGETVTTDVTREGYTMATLENAAETPKLAYFSDFVRDSLCGADSDEALPGFVVGGGRASAIWDVLRGRSSWCDCPNRSINYAARHEGYTLYDRLTLSVGDKTAETRIQMNKLAAAVVMTAQGVPFFQAGEEMLRSKPTEEGFDRSSGDSSDAVNAIRWDNLSQEAYANVVDYYTGLIAFRKAHPALRMATAQDAEAHIAQLGDLEANVVGSHISAGANGEDNEIIAIFNARDAETTVNLPNGQWIVYIDGEKAGTEPLDIVKGTVTVAAASACVMVKDPSAPEEVEEPTKSERTEFPVKLEELSQMLTELTQDLPALVAAALALISGISMIVILIRKHKK